MSDYPFQFEAKVQFHDFGKFRFSVVYLPKRLESKLPLKEKPRLRISGEISGIRFDAALQPTKSRWYMMVSRRMLKICGLTVGQLAMVEFEIADQDAVEVPDELRHALDADDEAAAIWNSLTPGKRRGFAYRIASAKRSETRERRVEEVLELLRAR